MNRAERYALCGAPTLYQRVAAIAAPALLLAVTAVILCCWHILPEEVSTGYDLQGNPTGWSGRAALLITPILGLATEGVMFLAELFPKSWNTGVRITPENRLAVYRAMGDMMADERISFAVLFTVLTLLPIFSTGTEVWTTAGFLVLAFWPLVRYGIRVIRIKRRLG